MVVIPPFVPTPEQIEAGTAEIRAGWTESDHIERSGGSFAPYEFPRMGGKTSGQDLVIVEGGFRPHSHYQIFQQGKAGRRR